MPTLVKHKKLRPPIRCFGGKAYLCDWVISKFPEDYQNYAYIEPFAGGLSVGLNKKRSFLFEIMNDLDPKLIGIWRAIKDDVANFQLRLSLLTYSEETFQAALDNKYDEPVNHYILCRMSRSGLKKDFSWSERQRRKMPGEISGWLSTLDQLPLISERLRHVTIENMDAIKLLLRHVDNPTVLAYIDCPYLHTTRVSTKSYGEFEMDEDEHRQLAEVLNAMRGKVLVSGYKSNLYDELYKGWKVEEKLIVNNASQSKKKRTMTECLFCNF